MKVEPCYVYVIGQQDRWDNPVLPLKVGISTNPWYRIMEFQSGCPVKLHLMRAYKLDHRQQAFTIEQRFHSSFARSGAYEAHGEWIGLALDQIDCVLRDLMAGFSFPIEELIDP